MNDSSSRITGPLQVVLMVVIVAATVIAGYLMIPGSQEERNALLDRLGTTNNGTFLVPPRPLAELPLRSADGGVWQLPQDHDWRLLIPGDGDCQDECREMVHVTRQVHMLLGKYTGRLERVYLDLGEPLNPKTAAFFDKQHPYLELLTSDRERFRQWLAPTNLDWTPGQARAILVDPRGDAMMFYDTATARDGLLDDLKHLFKYTPE